MLTRGRGTTVAIMIGGNDLSRMITKGSITLGMSISQQSALRGHSLHGERENITQEGVNYFLLEPFLFLVE